MEFILEYGIHLKAIVPFNYSLGWGGWVDCLLFCFLKKNEKEEVVALAEDIYEDHGIDKVVIVAGGREVILSISAEELLRRLLNKREKSSLMYTWKQAMRQTLLKLRNSLPSDDWHVKTSGINASGNWFKTCKYI